MSGTGHRVQFSCNGEQVEVDAAPGESLLSVLRERLAVVSPKDGCAPQGQCGCCTVLVDGEPRVACVTPATRVAGRSVVTVEGLDPVTRDDLAARFVATGGSQCGFCTPGILVRLVAAESKGKTRRVDLDRALAAHLCRCTGWQSVYDVVGATSTVLARDERAAARRAELEGGASQVVGPRVPLGDGGFADDGAPRDALVAVPLPPGSTADAIEAAGGSWVVAESLLEARALAAKVQGRRTTVDPESPLAAPAAAAGGVRLTTSWVEPAYLEPDASWCEPGGDPATPLANGGAFGGKLASPVGAAARELADRTGRAVRVVYAREDVVRLGPKRPPIAATAVFDGTTVHTRGTVVGDAAPFVAPIAWPYSLEERGEWTSATALGPPTASTLRAVGLAERAVLLEGALHVAGADRTVLVCDDRVAAVMLDACVVAESGAVAGARVVCDDAGRIERVVVRVAAGDPLDAVVLRSYSIGAAHMALGWVLTEGLAVDPDTGEVHDLTIRSFGILRAKDTPPIDVELVDDPGEPLARASDAVFAAVAAATWNAVSDADGERPETFPARETRAARALRR
ncbi:MAG TPA: 2Fe-2S iron-sulfur cluster-binding protein [Acidimicrobiia bacterium]|nr:2Fe-2S iron-sulfur cluster-binding protein [Acidimicrobiia bacterium]